jgi:hypothetical protein
MFSTKFRTIIITLAAAGSLGSATMLPVAAQAKAPDKQPDLEKLGYKCEHVASHFSSCTDDNGNEWYCDEQADECSQVKFGKNTKPTTSTKPAIAPLVTLVGVTAHR